MDLTRRSLRDLTSTRSALLVRFSGTEPLLRIYTEVQDESLVQKVLAAGKELVGLP